MENSFLGEDQSQTEIGTDRVVASWRKCLTLNFLALLALHNPHSNSNEDAFVRRGLEFTASWSLLTNAVHSIRYTGVKLRFSITDRAAVVCDVSGNVNTTFIET